MFRADTDDIDLVADRLSSALFAEVPFAGCESSRMGQFDARELTLPVLGLSVYLVHINNRDPFEYSLELEHDDLPQTDCDSGCNRRHLAISDGVSLSEFLTVCLGAIPGISVSQ